MYIEILNHKRLKVELLFEDMRKLNIDKTSFLFKDFNAKRALNYILKDAYLKTGFDIFNTKLTVEFFSTTNNGCMLIFTKMSPKRFKVTTVKKQSIFTFSSINNLLDCIKIILHKESLLNSIVYRLKSKYFLILDNHLRFDKSVLFVINEFSEGKSDISKSYLEEYGEIIFKKI